jgi:hypothetical protein
MDFGDGTSTLRLGGSLSDFHKTGPVLLQNVYINIKKLI